jgi:hypothetical protein
MASSVLQQFVSRLLLWTGVLALVFMFGQPSILLSKQIIGGIFRIPGVLFQSLIHFHHVEPDSLRGAMHNVTTDYHRLALLVEEFFETAYGDPSAKAAFEQYLALHASKTIASLEKILDWVLTFYKFLFPFVVISLLTKLSPSKGIQQTDSRKISKRDVEGHRYQKEYSMDASLVDDETNGVDNSFTLKALAADRHMGPDTPQQH